MNDPVGPSGGELPDVGELFGLSQLDGKCAGRDRADPWNFQLSALISHDMPGRFPLDLLDLFVRKLEVPAHALHERDQRRGQFGFMLGEYGRLSPDDRGTLGQTDAEFQQESTNRVGRRGALARELLSHTM